MANFEFRDNLPETITTDRLILRAPNGADVEAMARLANNAKIFQMLSRLPNPYAQSDAVEFIDSFSRSATEHAFSILTRDEAFIGVMSLFLNSEPQVEFGYWIGEPYWGEGYATEVALALIAAADAAGCNAINARARSTNKASIRVLEKTGFKQTDERIDDCGPHKGVHVTIFRRERMR